VTELIVHLGRLMCGF